jgi:hypothetical protein
MYSGMQGGGWLRGECWGWGEGFWVYKRLRTGGGMEWYMKEKDEMKWVDSGRVQMGKKR